MSFSTQEKLKKLIQEERFVIWFQPRFSAIDGEFCGSEALIRYFDEDDTIVSPMDFIPAMEYNETVHMIDLYVFRHVCEYILAGLRQVRILSLCRLIYHIVRLSDLILWKILWIFGLIIISERFDCD